MCIKDFCVSGGLVCDSPHHRRPLIRDGQRAGGQTSDPSVSPTSRAEGPSVSRGLTPAGPGRRFHPFPVFRTDVCDARLGEETPQQHGAHQVERGAGVSLRFPEVSRLSHLLPAHHRWFLLSPYRNMTMTTCTNMQLCLSPADKHKMERFLRPDAPTVVSVYAPITFSPAGVLLFKQRSDGRISV